jgi:polyhydroxyalkanoate synthesis repressor PhaR
MAGTEQKPAPEGKPGSQGEARAEDPRRKRTRAGGPRPTVVKKYANRRLYNTATSTYVTLEHLAQMVRDEEEFVVVDAKSGDDLTRSVLTQIIFEQENRGETMLPIPFLRQLIGLYGNNLQSFVPSYLEASMEAFAKNQEAMRKSMSEAFSMPSSGTGSGMQVFEDAAKRNMAFFEQGLKMFGLQPPTSERGEAEGEVRVLRAEVERLKAELAEARG